MLSSTPPNPTHSDEGLPPIMRKTTKPLVDYKKLNLRNKDSRKLFSSRNPNNALIWALIDDRKIEKEEKKDSDYDLAQSYIEVWKPGPMKGQIWRARTACDKEPVWVAPCVDVIWSGRDWLPYTASITKDDGLVYPATSKASVGLVESVKYVYKTRDRLAPSVPIKELNAAYISYSLDPCEEDNLKTTIYAYVRGSYIPGQVKSLLWNKHEIAVEEEDVVMDFIAYLFGMLPNYKHDGKMQNWITHSWKKYFFPSQQRDVIEYTDRATWMNEVPPKDMKYEHLYRCVSLLECHSDTVDSHRTSCEDSVLTKELLTTNPKSPWFQLSEASRQMLLARLEGETNNQAAERLKCTPQHAGRLLKAAVKEAKKIDGTKSAGISGGLGWS